MSEVRTLLEKLFAAFNRGDIPFILQHVSEECSLRGTLAPELPYSGVYRGVAGAGKYFEGIAQALEPSALVVDQYVCEGEHIVAVGRWSGRARASGKPFDAPLALYFRFRDGKMIDFRGHEDTAVTLGAIRG